jgi:hypothetical protein
MTKATEVINHLFDHLNEQGMSSLEGIYSSYYFPIHTVDIDFEPRGIVKNSVKDALFITNQLKNSSRICVLSDTGPTVISTSYAKRGKSLDLHVTCGSVELLEELPEIIATNKKSLEKYSRDCGFTPGIHYYNLIDLWIPWNAIRTLDIEKDGWN